MGFSKVPPFFVSLCTYAIENEVNILLIDRRIISLSLRVLIRTILDIVNVEPSGM